MKKNHFIILSLFLSLMMSSCVREGCTDRDADNYMPDAKRSDFSCMYTGYHVIWYGIEVANFLKQHTTYLHISTSSGQRLVHRAALYAYGEMDWTGAIVLKQTMGTKNMGFDYVIITDDDGYTVWSGDITYGVPKTHANSTELIMR